MTEVKQMVYTAFLVIILDTVLDETGFQDWLIDQTRKAINGPEK